LTYSIGGTKNIKLQMLNFFLRACIGYKKRSMADRSCWVGTKTVLFYSSESSLSQYTDLDSSCLICHLLLISDVKRKNTETHKNYERPSKRPAPIATTPAKAACNGGGGARSRAAAFSVWFTGGDRRRQRADEPTVGDGPGPRAGV
jgi:hypothetical protein